MRLLLIEAVFEKHASTYMCFVRKDEAPKIGDIITTNFRWWGDVDFATARVVRVL